jgi:hypothetical protein
MLGCIAEAATGGAAFETSDVSPGVGRGSVEYDGSRAPTCIAWGLDGAAGGAPLGDAGAPAPACMASGLDGAAGGAPLGDAGAPAPACMASGLDGAAGGTAGCAPRGDAGAFAIDDIA